MSLVQLKLLYFTKKNSDILLMQKKIIKVRDDDSKKETVISNATTDYTILDFDLANELGLGCVFDDFNETASLLKLENKLKNDKFKEVLGNE